MSTAIQDFFTSELKLCPSDYVIITVSDNAKLPSFEYNKERPFRPPSLTRSNRSAPTLTLGSNKRDYRWGEASSPNCQWDSAPGYTNNAFSRPAIADRANAADTFSKEVPHLVSPSSVCAFSLSSTARDRSSSMRTVFKDKLPFEVRADQALLTGTNLSLRQNVSESRQTASRPRMMDPRYQSNSMPSLRAPRPGEKSRSKKSPPKYTCDKQADNHIKIVKKLGHLATREIQLKGGSGPPRQPRRRRSIYSKAA